MADYDAGGLKKTLENIRLAAWKQRRSVDVLVNPKTCWGKVKEYHLLVDVISKIFLEFSAQYLHNVIRHVCKEWYLVIRSKNFAHQHARNSGCGLIIQDRSFASDGIYVEMRQGSLGTSKCGVGYLVWSSCNGLVLVPDFRDPGVLSIVNPLTKHRTTLPSVSGRYSEFVLAFVEASMEYKVVHKPSGWKMQLGVLTIGVDSVWRRVNINVPRKTREDLLPRSLVTGAYINWIGTSFVLTFSLETETVRPFPFPQSREERGTFLSMGNKLSVVYKSGRRNNLRDVWEMDPKTGNWTMLHEFGYELGKGITPFGWLVAREVLVFSASDIQTHCIFYNLKTREIQCLDLDKKGKSYHFQAHVNSLVRLEEEF